MIRTLRVFAALVLFSGTAVAQDWTRSGGDAGMTKYSPGNIPATTAPELAYKKRFYGAWAWYTGNYFHGHNLVVRNGQGAIFSDDAPSGTLQVTKFDWATSQTRAKFAQPYFLGQHSNEIDSHHYTNPLIWHSDGRIYSRRGGDQRFIYVLDESVAGAWSWVIENPAPENVAWGGDATAFLQTYGDRLIYRYGDTRSSSPYAAYDISSNAWQGEWWQSGALGAYTASLGPSIAGDQWRYGDTPKVARNISVVAANASGNTLWLEAHDLTTGALLWQRSWASDAGGARGFYTSLSDYWRFLATEDGHFAFFSRPSGSSCVLRVLDLATGAERWNRTLTNSNERPLLAYHAGALYVVGRAQQFKLSADTGTVLWQAGGSFPNDTGYIHRNYWSGGNSTNDPIYRPAVLTDDTLWFVNGSAANSGVLVGLKTADGSVARTIDLAALARVGTESLELVNDLVAVNGKLGVLVTITDSADINTPKNKYQDLYVYNFPATPPPTNRAPVANGQTVAATESVSQAITLSATDADNDRLFYYIVSSPAHGRLSGTAPNLVYSPVPAWNGTDSFTYRVNDGYEDSNVATVTLNVAVVTWNAALAAHGATATASSTYDGNYSPSAAINDDRRGTPWGNGGGWNDATATLPDWLQVDFAANETINEINVFSLQDDPGNPVYPTLQQTFTLYGNQDFVAQYWDGAQWLAVPNGTITGNAQVWRRITFPPLTTSRIRIFITRTPDGYSRLTEVEAWRPRASSGNQPPTAAVSASPTSGTAPLDVSFNGTGSFDPDGTIVSYSWTFGDGQTGSGATTSHAYAAAGTYTAILTVTDNGGATGSASAVISVSPVPDTEPPSAPTITSFSGARKKAQITWSASTDNVGVTGYTVWRNGAVRATTASTTYTDTAVTTGQTYSYFVQAYDAVGNVSPSSNTVAVTVRNGR